MNKFPMVIDYVAYAGIGSRETPPDILNLMRGIACMLDERGYVLRSGGAEGADTAFDSGTSGMSHPEIYLPWDGFNGHKDRMKISKGRFSEALEMARKHHPFWENCSPGARKLLGRNTFQILGRKLDSPSAFVICWTKDGKFSGGTGQALRVAKAFDIPIYNLQDKKCREYFYTELGWEH